MSKKTIYYVVVSATLLMSLFLVPHAAAYAQTLSQQVNANASGGNFVPLTSVPAITQVVSTDNLSTLLNAIYKICIGVAATLAVLQIMRAGVEYMGGDSVTEVKQARHLIETALLGLALVLSPVIVFGLINPNILSLNIGFSCLTPGSTCGASGSTSGTGTGSGSTSGNSTSGSSGAAGATSGTAPATTPPTGSADSQAATTPTGQQGQITPGQYFFAFQAVSSNNTSCQVYPYAFDSLSACQAQEQASKANIASQEGAANVSKYMTILYDCTVPANGVVTLPDAGNCAPSTN